ncbi:MAG: Coenzyme F420 hydrogenase/dehydrogenase, beta subunit C-terminal domain [Candidatus Sumerlaeia bacterium]|nr:Coenzyme F420 hydrogenase/dehydrogenase, beta subunit C-terminal domain [Candidatus Sumerlaeia bacterium]
MTTDRAGMKELIQQIRETARRLLEEGRVELVLGFEPGPLPLRNTPCFVRSAGEADRLIWDRACGSNLAVFLNGPARRIAVMAKGCDSRAIVNLLKERRFARENIVIVGVPCAGMIDRRKVERQVGETDLDHARVEGELLVVRAGARQIKLPVADVLRDACRECSMPTPVFYDILLDGAASRIPAAGSEVAGPTDRAERWRRFEAEAAKCIRCYACRNVCPLCYCRECCADQTGPRWVGPSPAPADNQVFLLMRALHLAGRCVDCGACIEACPAGVDVRYLFKRMEREVRARFGYESGRAVDEKPPLAGYGTNDPEDFITDV